MTKILPAIMEREMTRKEFMAFVALGLGSIMGFSHLIQLFTGHHPAERLNQSASHGYGSSPYGV